MDNEKWNQRYQETNPDDHQAHSVILEEQLKGLPPGRALDLAAGEGRNSLYLARQGWQVTAVDFSDVAVKNGRRLAKTQGVSIDWDVADLAVYLPEKEAFDLVCLFYLHVPRELFRKILIKAAEALKPGGTLLVVGHDLSNLTEGFGGPRNPEVLYSPRDVADMLEFMEIREARRESHPGDHGNTDRDKIQIDCVVRAVKPVLP
jgi:SAM-dependent methyltransferase